MECWSNGVMEYWDIQGSEKFVSLNPLFQYSSIPSFQNERMDFRG
jgi:hypothetical protein